MGPNERVKFLRVELLQLRQSEFGQELGVGATAISKIESGDRSLTDQMVLAICRRWGVSELWLRTGEGEPLPVKPGPSPQALLDYLTSLDPALLPLARSYIDYLLERR